MDFELVKINSSIEFRPSNVPVNFITGVTDFTDTVIGETATGYLNKFFRYSIDNINFTPWTELTTTNISNIVPPLNLKDILDIEFKYVKVGSNNITPIQITAAEVIYVTDTIIVPEFYSNSIFKQFFDFYDQDVIITYLSLIRKIYNPGILPKFISREGDFFEFWNPITYFVAILINYIRSFGDIFNNETLALLRLESKNLFHKEDFNFTDIQYFLENYFREIRKRGTLEIVKSEIDYLGELRRLINYESGEFIFGLSEYEKTGWFLENNGPCYRGVKGYRHFIKGFEVEDGIEDLANYPIENSSYLSLSQNEITISQPLASERAGIFSSTVPYIDIITQLNYEIILKVKITGSDPILPRLTFGCMAFDINDNQIDLKSIKDYSDINYFFQNLVLKRVDEEYTIKGIIYNQTKSLLNNKVNYSLNIQTGAINSRKLQFPVGVEQITPFVYFDREGVDYGATTNQIVITEFKVIPLNLDYALQFLRANNIIQYWLHNNTVSNERKLEELIRKYLVPANSTLVENWLLPLFESIQSQKDYTKGYKIDAYS